MKEIFFLIVLLVASVSGFAQQCRDLKGFEFGENRRFTFPAKVTAYDGVELSIVVPMKNETRVTKFPIDSLTEFPVGFDKNYREGYWTIVYCGDTRTVLWVQKFVELKDGYESKEKQDKRLAKSERKKH